MLPDVCNDHCVQAARNMGCQFMESFFFRAALEVDYREESHHYDAENKAQELMKVWARKGFLALPEWCKKYAMQRAKGTPIANVFSNQPILKKGA